MTLPARDAGEVDALATDRYLDALLARQVELASVPDARRGEAHLDAAVRAVSRRLTANLPRFHPSFRFEERLALRLAEAAAAMRLPLAAGGEDDVARISVVPGFDPLGLQPDDEAAETPDDPNGFPWRGAVAASALSLAGAAWYAWRHRPVTSPMGRAARAAHANPSRRPISTGRA